MVSMKVNGYFFTYRMYETIGPIRPSPAHLDWVGLEGSLVVQCEASIIIKYLSYHPASYTHTTKMFKQNPFT